MVEGVRLDGLDLSAECKLQGGTLLLHLFPPTDRRTRMLTIEGPVSTEEGSSLERLRRTLLLWLAKTDRLRTREDREEAERVHLALGTLLRAVVTEACGSSWGRAALDLDESGHCTVSVDSADVRPQTMWMFSSDYGLALHGVPSPALMDAIGKIVGAGVHVTNVESTYCEPTFRIGPPEATEIWDADDAMANLRAIASLPPGARLIPARDP